MENGRNVSRWPLLRGVGPNGRISDKIEFNHFNFTIDKFAFRSCSSNVSFSWYRLLFSMFVTFLENLLKLRKGLDNAKIVWSREQLVPIASFDSGLSPVYKVSFACGFLNSMNFSYRDSRLLSLSVFIQKKIVFPFQILSRHARKWINKKINNRTVI